MTYFLIGSEECPKCGGMEFWNGLGFDYDTYERISWCDDCGYEEREFDKQAKDDFELLEKVIRKGRIKSIKIRDKKNEKEVQKMAWIERHKGLVITLILLGISIGVTLLTAWYVGGMR